jgi:hypothetical protein
MSALCVLCVAGHSAHAVMSLDSTQTEVSTSGAVTQTTAVPVATAHPAAAAAATGRQDPGLPGDSSDEEAEKATFTRASKRRSLTAFSERWVPYKQTNGVAVYHLEDSASGETTCSRIICLCPCSFLHCSLFEQVCRTHA